MKRNLKLTLEDHPFATMLEACRQYAARNGAPHGNNPVAYGTCIAAICREYLDRPQTTEPAK
jgi:hypothetical protein